MRGEKVDQYTITQERALTHHAWIFRMVRHSDRRMAERVVDDVVLAQANLDLSAYIQQALLRELLNGPGTSDLHGGELRVSDRRQQLHDMLQSARVTL